MMKRKKVRSKKSIVIASLALMVSTIVGVTLAIVSMRTSFKNQFNTSAYRVGIEEEFYNKWGTKIVNIFNQDQTPVIIRVSYNELWSMTENVTNTTSCKIGQMELADGVVYTLSNKIDNTEVVTKGWTSTWLNDFVKGNDGWYYYNKVLSNGDKINILNSINLDDNLIKTTSCYRNYYDFAYNLDFNYEAIQATEDAVKLMWGYDVTINDKDVTWSF